MLVWFHVLNLDEYYLKIYYNFKSDFRPVDMFSSLGNKVFCLCGEESITQK